MGLFSALGKLAPTLGTLAGGFFGGPMGAKIGGMAGGALGGLMGNSKSAHGGNWSQTTYGMMDPNLYGYTQGQRDTIRDQSFGMMSNLFPGATAQRFWQGTGAPGMGGGSSSATGYGATGYGASAERAKAQMLNSIERLDLTKPTYSFEMPAEQEERLLGKSQEMIGAQERDRWMQMQDELARSGGSSTSAAALRMRGDLARGGLKAGADALRDVRSDWFGETRGLRHSAMSQNTAAENQRRWANQAAENQARMLNAQLGTQANIASASNRTSASIASAANRTSASNVNAGNALGWANLDFNKYKFLFGGAQQMMAPNAQQQIVQTGQRGGQTPGWLGGMAAGGLFGSQLGGLFGGGSASGAGSGGYPYNVPYGSNVNNFLSGGYKGPVRNNDPYGSTNWLFGG